jgi:hypothetical protein
MSENLLAFTEKANGIISERKRESNMFDSFDKISKDEDIASS